MNPCIGCRFADWKKTAAGRLHPDKTGRCRYEVVLSFPASVGDFDRHRIASMLSTSRFIERDSHPIGECQVREASP